jgi:cation:H+ antiporter
MLTLLMIAAGLVSLILGAEALVRGASALALRAGISPLVVGLTIVATATSAPEITTSFFAALTGHTDLAVGNVVGSNIFNVLFILGLAAIITPLVVARRLVRTDVPVMIGATFGVIAMAYDGAIGRVDGVLLLTGFAIYLAYSIRESRGEPTSVVAEYDAALTSAAHRSAPTDLLLLVAGIGLLVLGSRLLVEGAVITARAVGISELVIALTIVAAGTSLPKVVTSIVAGVRRQADISIGNVIGSNIVNIMLGLGVCGLLSADGAAVSAAALRFDIPVMAATAVACLPIFVAGYRIDRWQGFVLLGYYVAYVTYLILDAAEHDALPAFSATMLGFVVPLTVLTFTVVLARRRTRAGAADPALQG